MAFKITVNKCQWMLYIANDLILSLALRAITQSEKALLQTKQKKVNMKHWVKRKQRSKSMAINDTSFWLLTI